MRIRPLFLAVTAVLSLTLSNATADVLLYQFFLDGPSENPPVPTPGTGTTLVTVDTTLSTMRVEATFSDLIGTVTMAHIHCCVAPPGNVGVATVTPTFTGFPSGVTSGSYDNTFDMTQASSYNSAFVTANGGSIPQAFNALLAGLNSGQAYFNIHTSFRGGGEIRGFANLIPEPTSATLALVGLGLPVLLRRT